MGTRNSTLVKLDGEIKVAQYGQWDGYPTGQGQTIQDFLKKVDIKDFKEKVKILRPITKEETEEVNNTPNWQKEYPYLSRDAGADVLNMIADGKVKFLVLDPDFINDSLLCEYWYELNLNEETVIMNGRSFTFEEWKKEGFMEELEKQESDEE